MSYAGFWWRFLAAFVDGLASALLYVPLLALFPPPDLDAPGAAAAEGGVGGGVDTVWSWLPTVLSAAYTLGFWLWRQATPGKMAVRARIVDARTGGRPSAARLVLRYLGYFVSALPLCLGFLWVAFDRRKQGWHDKIAGTVVVRAGGAEPVRFEAAGDSAAA